MHLACLLAPVAFAFAIAAQDPENCSPVPGSVLYSCKKFHPAGSGVQIGIDCIPGNKYRSLCAYIVNTVDGKVNVLGPEPYW